MPRWFLAAAAGVVVLVGGALAFIGLQDSEAPRAAAPAASPSRVPEVRSAPAALPEGVPLAGHPTTVIVPGPSAAAPAPPGEVPARLAAPAAVERTWPALLQRIAAKAPGLDDCFDEETQARYGPQAHTALRSSLRPDSGTAVLVLLVEAVPGGVRIEDAPLEKPGSASDGLLACAQASLRGLALDVPGGPPGARYRIRYPLQRPGGGAPLVRAPRVRRPVKP